MPIRSGGPDQVAAECLVSDPVPRRDLDLASYGLVRLLPGGPPAGYQGLGWEPKLAFEALADLG